MKLAVLLVVSLGTLALRPGAQARFDANEPLTRALRYASVEAGLLFKPSAAPYRAGELIETIDRLRYGVALSEASATLLHSLIERELDITLSQGLTARLAASLSAELYLGTHQNTGAGRPWSWAQRLPAIGARLDLSGGGFLGRVNAELREDHNAIDRLAPPVDRSNWPESFDYVDLFFPFEAYTGYDGPWFWLWGGRDRLRWGPGLTGALALSDAPDYYDFLEAGLYQGAFSYRTLILPLGWPEPIAQNRFIMQDKNLILHRLDIVGRRIGLSLYEGLMVGGVALNAAMMNPFMVLHNLFAWNMGPDTQASSIMGAELRYLPWRYIEAYASFASQQLQTPYEIERYDAAAIPNAFAYQLGFDAAYPAWGGWLTLRVEHTLVNPWMYVRETELISYSWRRAFYNSNVPGYTTRYSDACIGYELGPDALSYALAIGWDKPGSLNAQAQYRWVAKGENSFDSDLVNTAENAALRAPSGQVSYRHSLGLSIAWELLPYLSLHGDAALEYSEAWAFESRFGFTISY